MIEYVKGDFIDGPETCIVHGCNAQGVMGAGAALAVKKRLPFAFATYQNWHANHGGLKLGSVVWAVNPDPKASPMFVGNAITQEHWHRKHSVNGMNLDYDAVRSCFRIINEMAISSRKPTWHRCGVGPIARIGMPKIGAGLGGGDWSVIERIINEEAKDFTPVVYELE